MKKESNAITFCITEETQNSNLEKVSVGYKCNLNKYDYLDMIYKLDHSI